MAELGLAVRRSLLLSLLLAVGALAAALPALLGEPESEHPALRGLAALLIAFLAAIYLTARWGSRGALEPKAHLLELAQVATAIAALLLPALFAGMTTGETRALANLAQAAIGWTKPITGLPLALWLLSAAYVVSRLRISVKEERLAGPALVVPSVVAFLILFVAGAWRLAQVPAPVGLEVLEKRTSLLTLLTLGIAACSPGKRARRGFDLRMIVLVSGFLSAGALLFYGVHAYLQPSLGDIDRVLGTTGDAKGTSFAASLQGRPDLYGLFSLQYASGTPRLAVVRPIGTPIDSLIEKVVPTGFGSARLEPQPDFGRISSERRAPPLDESFEVWFRLKGWPRLDLPSGIRIHDVPYDWAVSPSGSFAVASTYSDSFAVPSQYGLPRQDRGTAAVRVWRRWSGPRTLIEGLPMTPRILELTESSVRLLVFGQPSSQGQFDARNGIACSAAPGPAQLGTTTCDLTQMKCEPWQMRAPDFARTVQAGPRLLVGGMGSWSLLDPISLETVATLPRCETCTVGADLVHLLRDGRILRLSLLGRVPNWDSRLTAYDVDGRETAATSLGNVRLTRFAGELDDGTLVILWRAHYAYSFTEPIFGWTLDSWNPRTGERRRLADDLGTFPCSENDASMIFLDRNGRMVVPAVDGVRALARLGYPLPVN